MPRIFIKRLTTHAVEIHQTGGPFDKYGRKYSTTFGLFWFAGLWAGYNVASRPSMCDRRDGPTDPTDRRDVVSF